MMRWRKIVPVVGVWLALVGCGAERGDEREGDDLALAAVPGELAAAFVLGPRASDLEHAPATYRLLNPSDPHETLAVAGAPAIEGLLARHPLGGRVSVGATGRRALVLDGAPDVSGVAIPLPQVDFSRAGRFVVEMTVDALEWDAHACFSLGRVASPWRGFDERTDRVVGFRLGVGGGGHFPSGVGGFLHPVSPFHSSSEQAIDGPTWMAGRPYSLAVAWEPVREGSLELSFTCRDRLTGCVVRAETVSDVTLPDTPDGGRWAVEAWTYGAFRMCLTIDEIFVQAAFREEPMAREGAHDAFASRASRGECDVGAIEAWLEDCKARGGDLVRDRLTAAVLFARLGVVPRSIEQLREVVKQARGDWLSAAPSTLAEDLDLLRRDLGHAMLTFRRPVAASDLARDLESLQERVAAAWLGRRDVMTREPLILGALDGLARLLK